MLVTISSSNTSIHEGNRRYIRGEVYTVDEDEGAALLATGRFRVATLPPPDPLMSQKQRAAALIGRLAAMGDSALDRLEAFLTASAPEPAGPVVHVDDLEVKTIAQLKATAEAEGTDVAACRLKADYIVTIRAGRGRG